MKAAHPKPVDELRMSEREFDRIMGQALGVKPEDVKRPTAPSKRKLSSKSKVAQK